VKLKKAQTSFAPSRYHHNTHTHNKKPMPVTTRAFTCYRYECTYKVVIFDSTSKSKCFI